MVKDHIKIMASDALKYVRDTRDPKIKFKALIGSCLAFANEKVFLRTYSSFIDRFDEFGNSRMGLKASEIRSFYGDEEEKFLGVIEEFVKGLDEIGVRINLCFSVFNSKVLDEQKIKIYGTRGISERKISVSEFIDNLFGCYSYIPAWKTSKIGKLHDTHVMIDCFNGEITNAWEELKAHHDGITIVPKGDQVNPFISASDIVTRYFDDKLRNNKAFLNNTEIERIGKYLELNNFNCFSVSNPDLNSIKPLSKNEIIVQNHYPNMVYLIREGKKVEDEFHIDERRAIENSPLWTDLINIAFQKGFGLKYVDVDYDFRNLKKEDIIVYYGDIGRGKAEYFRSLGHKISNRKTWKSSNQNWQK